jgi:DNA-binding PucR family transcriptional regulator
MAHSEDVKRAVRASFVFDGLDLPAAAAKHGISEGTARRWKCQARELGDDWDKARGAQLLAGGGIEEVARQTLALVVMQVQATLQAIQDSPDMKPETRVQLLASMADAYNKLLATSKRLMPETTQLATAMDVIQRLGAFIKQRYPKHLGAFAEVLEPFGEQLERDYG